jgi:adenine-specific DNA-methyltransferase
MARPKKVKETIDVDSIKHQDTRVNIPTEELRNFVKDDGPKTLLYPRDPSLDPQLVWKGKDEQDRKDLAVPSTPIYIQEKIHPQVIIEDLLKECSEDGKGLKKTMQLDLFSDFNGLPKEFDKRVDFYHHDQHWSNRMILGDSLLVMASLAEKEGLKGKVQMIYIDPPYGIKFGSNWQVSTFKNDLKDGRAEDATRQPEQVKAFRDTWELGIHSYLAYLRDRLKLANDLLGESGSIFIQIGDENVHLVRCLLDETFGPENFICHIVFQKTGGFATSNVPSIADHILWYGKNSKMTKIRPLFLSSKSPGSDDPNYVMYEMPDGKIYRMRMEERRGESPLPTGANIFRYGPLTSDGKSSETVRFSYRGITFEPPPNGHWKVKIEGLQRLEKADRLIVSGNKLYHKLFWDYFPAERLSNIWMDTQSGGF